MSDVVIRLENVSKFYKLYDFPGDRLKEALSPFGKNYHKDFYALKNINLEIKKGEILGVVGKNGSGKSTLLKIISGVMRPNEGKVEVNGKISAMLELGSGFNPDFTGIQNIYFSGIIHGFSKKEMDARIDEIADFADIGDFINQPVKSYSSGMKSRLGFAVAIHSEPDILILDEVLAVGDVMFRRKCYSKMEEYFKGGKTIIYVSHDTNSVNELCSRAVFIDQGCNLLDADAKTVTSHYEKYLFSNENSRESVRNEIIKIANSNEGENVDEDLCAGSSEDTAYFLPDFKSKTSLKIDNYDVDILDPMVKTMNGETVNVLKTGERYVYSFNVVAGVDLNDVSFGTKIKSSKGLVIAGASFNNAKKHVGVLREGSYFVEWEFDCSLLAGVYYTDTSVTGVVDGERKVLCRIKDCYVFKVMPNKGALYAGLVSLNQVINFNKLN